MISFIVPGLPIAQPRARAASIGGHARIVGFDDRHPVTAFKATVRLLAQQHMAGRPPIAGPVQLVVMFGFRRPGRLIWKKRPMPRCWHTSKPDADNCVKALKDALNGIAWRDDAQVAQVMAEKVYVAGDEAPHVAVQVYAIELEPCQP